MKKPSILFTLLLLIIALLVSCGDEVCSHADTNEDGVCDSCGEAIAPSHSCLDSDGDGKCDECGCDMPISDLVLLEDGIASFKFVLAGNLSYNARQTLSGHIDRLKAGGTTVKAVEDKESNLSEYEILIGDVQTRGNEYFFDEHKLGMEGYAIKRIGNKIIIVAGSSDIMPHAIDAFFSDVLGFGESVREVPQNVIYGGDVVEIQDNYSITSIKIVNNDLGDYVIYAEPGSHDRSNAAKALQDALYANAGYYLNIVESLDGVDKYVKIGAMERVKGEKGFKVTVDSSGILDIRSAYDSKLTLAMDDFLVHNVKIVSGDVVFGSDFLYEYESNIITYEEYGAKGDGKTDDANAIKLAHTAANAGGQTVVAKNGATYLIKKIAAPIKIRTDVNWGTATFIIDNSSSQKDNIFHVASTYSSIAISGDALIEVLGGTTIDKDTLTSVSWEKYGYAALLYPIDSTHRDYIRYGGNADRGNPQTELIKIDADGNVSPDTPLLFDFLNVTSITVIRTEDAPITIEGGIFRTSYAGLSKKTSLSRGMLIERSNVTLKNVQHYVDGQDELTTGPASGGFFYISNSDNVLLSDCVLTARKYFSSGTYDITVYGSNNVTLKNCIQSNFYLENGKPSMTNNQYWGIMGSNYCKNITFDGCTLSRFDAHCGIYNAKILNSTINAIEIIGGGSLYIENTHIVHVRSTFIELRNDYGGTFRGTVTIRNCTVTPKSQKSSYTLISAFWANHNFGYDCYLPSVVIDGLKVEGLMEGARVYIFSSTVKKALIGEEYLEDGVKNLNVIKPPDFVELVSNDSGYTYVLYDTPLLDEVLVKGDITRIS